MPDQPQPGEVVRAFIDHYDLMLGAVEAPRLTLEQREVLRGLLDAMAMDEPRLIKVLQSTYETQKWIEQKRMGK